MVDLIRRGPQPGGRRHRRDYSATRERVTQFSVVGLMLGAFIMATSVDSAEIYRDRAEAAEADSGVAEMSVAAPVNDLVVSTEVSEEPIPAETITKTNSRAFSGSKKVIQQGKDGVAIVSHTVTFVDGVETERETVQVITTEPVPEIVEVGSLTVPQVSDTGANREAGKRLAAEIYGWSGDEWQCLNYLWTKESNWRHNAHNKSSGAHGIPQALPGSKMASAGSDWLTNPETQIKWGLGYIKNRYQTPCGAVSHFQNKNWY